MEEEEEEEEEEHWHNLGRFFGNGQRSCLSVSTRCTMRIELYPISLTVT